MVDKKFKPNHPIILGILGEAGTGKTSLADGLVPDGTIFNDGYFHWDHWYFALPLYEMVAVKRKTRGQQQEDRILFGLHEVMFDLFGRSPLYGLPPYGVFTDLVRTVAEAPIEREGVKPRSFMQNAGTLCRKVNPDVFTNWIERKIKLHGYKDDDFQKVFIVSDVRMKNEAEMIKRQPNGLLIKLTTEETARLDRLEARDGYRMTQEQLNHESENVSNIPMELVDIIIDNTWVGVQEEVQQVRNLVQKFEEGSLNAQNLEVIA